MSGYIKPILFFKDFIYININIDSRGEGGEGEPQADSTLRAEPDMGLHLTALRS